MINEQTLKKLINDQGVELYDTEIVTENDNKIFRIYITSKDGVSLDTCTKITKIISPILDLEPPISGKYLLEVSSPGIDRKLTKLKHFENSIGELVKIKLTNGEKSKNKILKVKGSKITLYDKSTKSEKEIDFEDILKAKTYFEW